MLIYNTATMSNRMLGKRLVVVVVDSHFLFLNVRNQI